jgi:hypothetical protein
MPSAHHWLSEQQCSAVPLHVPSPRSQCPHATFMQPAMPMFSCHSSPSCLALHACPMRLQPSLGLLVPIGRLCRAEDVLVGCAVAGGWLAVLESAHTSPVGTLTPGGPGAPPPLGGAAPTPWRRGSRKTPPQESALLNQAAPPAWAPLPAPAPPACTTGPPPPPPKLGLPTIVVPGGASSQCVLGCYPSVYSPLSPRRAA